MENRRRRTKRKKRGRSRMRERIAFFPGSAECKLMGIYSTVTVDLYWDLVFRNSWHLIQRFEVIHKMSKVTRNF